MRKGILLGLVVGALVAVPVVVFGASGQVSSGLFQQDTVWQTTAVSTVSQSYEDVSGMVSTFVCADTGTTVDVSGVLAGGKATLRVQATVFGGGGTVVLTPDSLTVDPKIQQVFSFTFVALELSPGSTFALQWKSNSGAVVTLRKATMVIQHGNPPCG